MIDPSQSLIQTLDISRDTDHSVDLADTLACNEVDSTVT
jgi:hypothetical protein